MLTLIHNLVSQPKKEGGDLRMENDASPVSVWSLLNQAGLLLNEPICSNPEINKAAAKRIEELFKEIDSLTDVDTPREFRLVLQGDLRNRLMSKAEELKTNPLPSEEG